MPYEFAGSGSVGPTLIGETLPYSPFLAARMVMQSILLAVRTGRRSTVIKDDVHILRDEWVRKIVEKNGVPLEGDADDGEGV